MNITSIKKQKGNNHRLSVFIDGEYCFSIRDDEYFKLGIYQGMEITKKEIEDFKNCANYNDVRAAAIKYIGIRVRCKKDVEMKLIRLGYEYGIIVKVIDELIDKKYLNDETFSRKYISDRNKLKPKSKNMLKYELLSKGIDEDIVDKQLDEIEIDEYETAYQLAKKKFGKYDITIIEVRKKLIMYLKRRGYSDGVINLTIVRLIEKEE